MQTQAPSFFADQNRLATTKLDKDNPESLSKVAKEFEAIFLQMMLKSMRDASKSMQSDLSQSNDLAQYQELYDKQLSLHLSQSGGVGLAEKIVNQLGAKKSFTKEVAAAENIPKTIPNTIPKSSNKITGKNITIDKLATDHNNNKHKFLEIIKPLADQAAATMGVDPNILIAQSILETGWGQKIAKFADGRSSNNLFGIKADPSWQGAKVSVKTTEYKNGVLERPRMQFRAYANVADSMKDYLNFLQDNSRYSNVLAGNLSAQQYIAGLQQAGYATDPAYAKNVMRIYQELS